MNASPSTLPQRMISYFVIRAERNGPCYGGAICVAENYARKKSSTSIPACLSIARSVPAGMSPGWFGSVV